MKAALVFAGPTAATATFRPYRSRAFIGALADAGIDVVLIDLDLETEQRFATVPAERPGLVSYRNHVDRLPLILAQERLALVQTFGATAELGPVWRHAARTRTPLVHFVSSEGGIVDRPAGGARLLTGLGRGDRGFMQWRTRHASRHVAGVLGSNRADMGRHFRNGFFPRSRFSIVAPPASARPPAAVSPAVVERRKIPVFGFYDPEATPETLELLLRAVALTGQSDLFTLRIAPRALAGVVSLPSAVSAVEAADADAFLREVDVLVVPRADDRAVVPVLAALSARKSVIVPDTGALTEIVDYGRRGLLYTAGSAYHLAIAINVMAQAWGNRPFSFEGVEEAIGRTTPEALARVFAATWRRLA
ncbi:glycosyltransferase [Rhodoplanes roseus]|uniref:Glycosyltransferase subfamily 4-like N-terminal domain-containing protein n=1 Tax=Rhodoplanes roseus TaxID=29409 RepID=A0A327KN35_9BRAD|nr:glycosyltransferase [Rhodoplanes roseus]RAI40300.1 hypothetical protein CH341_24045 [Rhodoplanes roseus]